MAAATLDWSQCPAVESVPDRRSGAWVFRDTRMPVATVFLNLEVGSSEVTEARKWERISNGALLKMTEDAGFDLLLTTDKNVRYRQNLIGRKISIVVLGQSPWRLVRQHLDAIAAAVNAATAGGYAEVAIPFR